MYENLILLCNIHHQLVDAQPETYPVERLQAIKRDHEHWVQKRLQTQGVEEADETGRYTTEFLHSTMLPVLQLPRFVYDAPAVRGRERDVQPDWTLAEGVMLPFIVRGGYLWAFQDFSNRMGPFCGEVDPTAAERHATSDWWTDPDLSRWFVDLLNRTLNKLTGRRGLMLDREHHRYYFPKPDHSEEKSISYRSMNRDRVTRRVVWQPVARASGQPKGYWYHSAVALRFFRVSEGSWVLNMRSELRVTKDGYEPIRAHRVGSRVTKKKARLFNHDYLSEVHFWRDYLGESRPRIVMPFGAHSQLVVGTELLGGDVSWPAYRMNIGFASVMSPMTRTYSASRSYQA